MPKGKYYDKRSQFWAKYFEQAEDFSAFVDSMDLGDAEKWRKMEESIPALTEEGVKRLTGYNRKMNVLAYVGPWCGDCVRQGPMLNKIVESCESGVNLRFIDRDESVELQDELRLVGALRVPVVVFLTEDFHELGRFGDRLLSVYRRKALKEAGAACDIGFAPPEKELSSELSDWLDVFERMLLMLRLSPPLRARYGD